MYQLQTENDEEETWKDLVRTTDRPYSVWWSDCLYIIEHTRL